MPTRNGTVVSAQTRTSCARFNFYFCVSLFLRAYFIGLLFIKAAMVRAIFDPCFLLVDHLRSLQDLVDSVGFWSSKSDLITRLNLIWS